MDKLKDVLEASPAPTSLTRGELSLEDCRVLAQMLRFLRECLVKPCLSLGREGAVCPFMSTSLKQNRIRMGVVRRGQIPTSSHLEKVVLNAVQVFKAMGPSRSKLATFNAILLIFPDLSAAAALAVIDAVQRSLSSSLAKDGVLLSEFHKHNNTRGCRNPDFYPYRTPYPCLAIRHMVESDIESLSTEELSESTRRALLETCLENIDENSTGNFHIVDDTCR